MSDWSTACPDWEERLLAGRPLVPRLPLFAAEAERALRIFKRLRIPDLHGKPTMGEMAAPWLLAIVEAIFGSYDERTHRRMVQEFFLLIPKKNTKTSSGGAIMVEALILNRRPEGEFVQIAPTIEIADMSFAQAAGTIRADPELEKTFQIQRHIRTITHRKMGATLKVKAADTDVITGGKQVGTLVDELHVLASKKDAEEIMVELRGALTARPDGFLITITTQSKKPPVGVFKSELAKARAVRDGKFRHPLLPILYELPERIARTGDWKDRRYWGAVNPNLNRSVSLDYLERELAEAERKGPDQLALFASQHFNVEIGIGLRTDHWAGAEYWPRRVDPTLTFDTLLQRCEVVTIGIDGGGLDDLFGFGVIGREKVTRRWLAWGCAWCHESVLERRKAIASRLLDFKAARELTIVDDKLQDLGAIVGLVQRALDAGLLGGVGCDPAGLGEFVDAMDEIGVTQDNGLLIGVPQGIKLMDAVKTTERKLVNGTYVHAESGLLDWCVGNLKIEALATAIRVTKQTAGDAKIDPAMALFNAAFVMQRNPEAVMDLGDYLSAPAMFA
jgi:phage terminase large subunit-like protein